MLSAQWQSSIVWTDATGRMYYSPDAAGNKIPDFSHAGYRGGGIDLPVVLNKLTIGPISGDNTAHIQAAIDSVSVLPIDTNGYRGALLLDTGRYEIHGTLYVATDGVILRGSGDGEDPSMNTVLMGIGNVPNQRSILIVGGGRATNWGSRIPSTTSLISSDTVFVGDYTFNVENPENFAVGDNIVINHPCTNEWLAAIDGGGAVSEGPWSFGSQPLIFNRRIVAITDSTLRVDVPIYNTLNKSLSPSFVYTYDRTGVVTEVGVENLRIDIETAGANDEAHAWNALGLVQVEDAWVKDCSFLHFGLAGVYTNTATRITIQDCEALDPVAMVTGARMYNFNLLRASSQVLIKDCLASNGRHHYVSNGTSSVSGNVFLHCVSSGAYAASEGHRRWSMGLLYDNHQETAIRNNGSTLLGLYNRGDYGTAHGWSLAHSVAWNVDLAGQKLVVQQAPTAQNYAIACKGQVTGNGPWPGATGFIEGTGETDLQIPSLYEAQLSARLAGLSPVITSIEKDKWQFGLETFPNPSSGKLTIRLANSRSFTGTIFDLTGKECLKFSGTESWQGDLSDLKKGLYFVLISQDGKSQGIKWIKE